MTSAPTLRNAPCPCGSGLRYKDCHGALATSDVAVATATAAGPGTLQHGVTSVVPIGVDGHDVDARDARAATLMCERARAEWVDGDVSAADTCRLATEQFPTDVAAWLLLGEILRGTDVAAAADAWCRALAVDATSAEARFHLANLELSRGNAQAAIEHYQRAIALVPGHSGILNNLGLAFAAASDHANAQACYRQVLTLDPGQVDALSNLANSRFNSEVFGETLSLYDRLFAIKRSLPAAAWVQRGMSHQRMGDLAIAQEHFRVAAAMMPDDVRIQLNLGTVHSELKQFGDAEAAWMRALDLDPHNGHALSMLAHDRQHRCAWHGLERLFAEINALLESPALASEFNVSPFALLAMPSSPLAQLRAAQRYAAQIGAAPSAVPAVPTYASGERLRVGFVSSDLRDHPMAHLSLEYWERLDRDRIETFAYGIRAVDHGPTGQRIERAFEHFVDVSNASTADIVRRIRDDRIGVLFDLNGYTTHSRERIFVQRPAPIQVNCIGFPGTLGAAWYDYIHTDAISLTSAMEPFFSERALRMPHMAFPSDTRRLASCVAVSRVECGLPQDAFVFCCFNNAYKILPEVFAVWMRLLAAIDHTVLWLLDTSAKENLQREAALAGIDPRRLIFAPKVPVERHLARHTAADLFLDTLPYGAHTTANDALLAGLPVLTCTGDTLVSRIAASQLCAIDLGELVTTDLTAYEAAALDLVRNPTRMALLRAKLVANRDSTPLFDMARYARDFANVVTGVWQDHLARATHHDVDVARNGVRSTV